MRKWLIGLLLFAAAPALAQQAPTTVPEIPFDSLPNPLKLPSDMYFGEVAGVAVDSKHHVFAFTRGNTEGPAYAAAAAELLEFDANGNYMREIGHRLYAWSFAHAVRTDRYDNIWAMDKGSDMVIRFNPEGRVTMVFGRKQEASDEGTGPLKHPNPPLPPVDGLFRQVTDVTFDKDDNIYISDGYINSRVAKYDKTGKWVKSFGTPGDQPGQLNTPHSIVSDNQGNIYVADRGNARISVFNTNGDFERIIKINVPFDPAGVKAVIGNTPTPTGAGGSYGVGGTLAPGSPWALCITRGPNQVLYSADAFPGRIYKLSLDGKVLGVLGIGGRMTKQFGWIHEIACPSENELYVAELLNWRVQHLILHPVADRKRM